MVPIYFPFSFLSGRAAAHLEACFPSMGVYLPVEGVKEEVLNRCNRPGFLDTRVPDPGLDRAAEDLYRAAMQWKMATLGADVSFVKAWEKERAPFFDETTISYVRRDILRHGSAPRKGDDDLVEAKLFLRLALDHDLREAELVSGVGELEKKEKNLFEALRGEDEEADDLSDEVMGRSFAGPAEDPGARMTAPRLRSWAMVAARDTRSPGIFITDSAAVFEYIQERCPAMAPVADIEGIPAADMITGPATLRGGQETLGAFLERLVYGDFNETPPAPVLFSPGTLKGPHAKLSLFAIPDKGPCAFFEFFTSRAAKSGGTAGDDKTKSIIIGKLSID
ncbi:MAG: hypothetical protein ACOZBW_11405 [Thermodesulfobacteriota bacterium]